MINDISVDPEISEDGWYCYCPICHFFDLLPETDVFCPKCKIALNWDWYWELSNTK